MQFEDVKKLATGTVLFNLNRIIAPRLVTIVYLLGLAGIVLWAVNHFFLTFRFGFGTGLWGLLEIAVFGLLALVVLRIACEAVIVFFRAHQAQAATATTQPRANASLIDEVRGAIEELAEEEETQAEQDAPASRPAASAAPAPAKKAPAKRAATGSSRAKKATTAKAATGTRSASRTKSEPPKPQ